MSMRDYAVSGYGIVLNDIDGVDVDYLQELADDDIVSTQYSFTGEAFVLKDDGCEDWGKSESYDDDTIYFIELPKYPRLFSAAYPDMDACVRSMYNRYNSVRKTADKLPKLSRKDIREKLRSFSGTYYG